MSSPVFRRQDFPWALQRLAKSIDEIKEASFWQMIASKFFDSTPTEQPKIDRHLEQSGGNAI